METVRAAEEAYKPENVYLRPKIPQWIEADTIISARVTIGPAGPTPFLAEQTMIYLTGQPATVGTYTQAAEVALEEANLRTSRHRATAEYRAEMVRVQLPKTLAQAVERATINKTA